MKTCFVMLLVDYIFIWLLSSHRFVYLWTLHARTCTNAKLRAWRLPFSCHLNCPKKKKKDFFLSTFHLAYRINKPVRLAHVYVSNSLAVSSAWNYVTHKKFCTPKSAFHFKFILKKKKKRDLWTRALSGIYYWQG